MTGLTPYPGITEGTRGITLYQGITAPGGITDIGSADSFQPVGGSLLITGLGPTVTFPPRTFTPTGGSLQLTGAVPTVSQFLNFSPAAGSLTATGIVPDLTVTTPFAPLGVKFDGGTSLDQGATILGTDSSTGLASLWGRRAANGNWNWFGGTSAKIDFQSSASTGGGMTTLVLKDAAGASLFQINWFLDTAWDDGLWHNVIISWNTNFSAGNKIGLLTFDGVSWTEDSRIDADAAFNVGWSTMTNFYIGASGSGGNAFNGDISEFYANPGSFRDITQPAQIANFYNSGSPVDLGANGSNPTGSSPEVYLSVRSGDVANDFLTNRGTSGNFSVAAGSLSLSATNP